MKKVTRALLLTDVVDSTRMVESLGDERAAAVWEAHDHLARELLPEWRGREIDKTDGFLLLFESASDAAAYALAYHQGLKQLSSKLDVELAARAGLHVGELILRENAPEDVARGSKPLEVEGPAKPLTERVMSVAPGGRTLLTPAAREALGDTSLDVHGHGHWRMKGIAEPIELFEVGDAELPWHLPDEGAKAYRVVADGDLWKPVKEIPHNLPREQDAFVGRGADLAALAHLIEEGAALVTVLGTGGAGKTRLTRRFGWTCLGDYPGGVWFCDLSEARGISGIARALALALDVPLGEEDPVERLGAAIHGRGRCLVLLDNFEQLTELAEASVGRWLESAAEAVFVVTSRDRLQLRGEKLLAIEPLEEDPAIALFEVRAQAQDPEFLVTPATRDDVAAIVRTLDGLPLAIELAAARIRALPAAKLRQRLKDRFKLLVGASGVTQRQATLEAAIDWSWDLLAPWEKAAMAQCSAFAGGFTLESAEAVLHASAWPEAPSALDLVQALLDKSMLHLQAGRHDSEESYFGMYVSIHEYAAGKLRTPGAFEGSGPDWEQSTWARHGDHYARLGTDEALDTLAGHGGVGQRQALARELENLVAACRRAVGRSDAGVAAGACRAAGAVLEITGPATTAIELAESVLTLESLSSCDRAGVAHVAGWARQVSGQMDQARTHHEAALALARADGDRRREGIALGHLAKLSYVQGNWQQAHALYVDALAVHREVGNRAAEAATIGSLGDVSRWQGRKEEALERCETALAMCREAGDRSAEAKLLNQLGNLYGDQGRMEEALGAYEAALALAREVGHRDQALVLANLGRVLGGLGRLDEAKTHYAAALGLAKKLGERRYESYALSNLALVHAMEDRRDEARAAWTEALTLASDIGNRNTAAMCLANLAEMEALDGHLEHALGHGEAALAVAREMGDRDLQGTLLGSLGKWYAVEGQMDTAQDRFGEGEELLRSIGAHPALAHLLTDRAGAAYRAGDHEAAHADLIQAERVASEYGFGPASEIGRRNMRLREMLEEAEQPK